MSEFIPKLYVIVRDDLTSGQKIAQSCHAVLKYQHENSYDIGEWMNNSNTIVCLECNYERLRKMYDRDLHNANIWHSGFFEPDMNWQLTALVLEPTESSAEFVKDFELAK